MSVFTSFAGQLNIAEITSYSVANVSVPTSNTEVEIVIPDTAVYVWIYNRTEGLTRMAFSSGQSGTNYVSLVPGSYQELRKKAGTAMSIYVQCPKNTQTIELLYGH
jgi:hypothetical protein